MRSPFRPAFPVAVRAAALVLLVLGAGAALLPADEGQWLPEQLQGFDWPALRARGLELEPREIWDGKGGGLLGAAVNLNGCSASFVSPAGLVLTNYHCGYGAVNRLSTPENNLLEQGFIAGGQAAELPAPGYRVSVVRRIEDVTVFIEGAAEAAGRDPKDRYQAVRRKVAELVAEGERRPHTSVRVTALYEGREWRRISSSEYTDVRLVYAPPAAIGEYGGETDNWMWPRHTGDFAFFRAYAAPDGSPAAYSPENVPLRPARWLEVSAEGIAEDELVLIMGYPGRTERYLSATAVRAREEFLYPARLRFFTQLIDALRSATARNPAWALKVASQVKSCSNARKNAEGMLWGLRRNEVLRVKKAEEEAFAQWVQPDPVLERKYGKLLDDLEALDLAEEAWQRHDFTLQQLRRRSLALDAAVRLMTLYQERRKPDLERLPGYQQRDLARLRTRFENLDRSFCLEADSAVLALLLELAADLPEPEAISGVPLWLEQHRRRGESFPALAERAIRESGLNDDGFRLRQLEAVMQGKQPETSPLTILAGKLIMADFRRRERHDLIAGKRMSTGALWIEAQQEFRGNRFYPDANGTLRVSVASVKGYSPEDGVFNTPHTTVDGLVAKNTGRKPFHCPAPLLAAVAQQDFGPYASPALGSVPVCFLTDGDTTGGNSGSPLVDGKGRLVGLNFDRVFENVVGDFGWNAARSRNISVDVRYILWLLERVYPAPQLLEEMGVAPSVPAPGR